MIRVADVHESFKDVAALRGVDLDVPRGSIFALLGSNGAGGFRGEPAGHVDRELDQGSARVTTRPAICGWR